MLVGLSAVMAWKAAAFPLTFSVVGESLPPERRATAFAIQSVMVRVPRVVSAPLGGLAIGAFGILAGFRLACAMTVAIALGVLLLQYRLFRDREPGPGARTSPRAGAGRRPMHPQLRRLLVADCLVRIGEGIAASFIVLFVTQVARRSAAEYGMLYAVQQAVAIAAYLPGARMVRFTGRRPVVALTFVFFAVFPLAVRHAGSDAGLFAAFLLGGLKELGEPARKSLIVDLSPDDRRASTIGTYYTIRNLLVVPAGLIGGLLWQQAPHLPLEAAAAVGLAGAALFLATGTDRSERA
jgi:predicted MFS family arabinose efflux permease